MSCFRPKAAWQPLDGGRAIFVPPIADARSYVAVSLPCGRCVGCRSDYARDWGLRCAHEAQMHERLSSFVTLTYDDEHLPKDGALCPKDLVLFWERVRKSDIGPFRYFAVGEYGEATWRPHYHCCMFGVWPADAVAAGKSQSGFPQWESRQLTELWGKGRVVFGEVTRQTAAYCAGYALKKLHQVRFGLLRTLNYGPVRFEYHGDGSKGYRLEVRLRSTGTLEREAHLPLEFMRCSKGIGRSWLDKFHGDVFPCDYAVADGQKLPVPRFYVRVLREWCDEEWQALKERRFAARTLTRVLESLPNRLAVRESVKLGLLQFAKRSVE